MIKIKNGKLRSHVVNAYEKTMPIYEYVCNQCRQPFEALVRGDEKPECPHCGSLNLSKQFSVLSAHCQGGGSATGGRSMPSAPM